MKSLLIIDTPCSCVTCPLSFYSEHWNEYQCGAKEYCRTIPDYEWQKKQMCGKDIKPDWCPLRPLPNKKSIPAITRGDSRSTTHLVQTLYGLGYNECIDDILKENKI